MMTQCFVILGAGHAGTAAAAAMRGAGFAGRIVMIGDDPHLPYERPPLSKQALKGSDAGAPAIYPAAFYVDRGIELRLGQPATAIDPATQVVRLADGEVIHFDKLLMATGARARRYPLLDTLGDRAHVLRTADDARRLSAELVPGRRLLVVGGGVIGLEVAATACSLGLSVDVIERAPRLLARGTPEPLAEWLAQAHREHGVRVHCGVELVNAAMQDEQVCLTCGQGRDFVGDMVVYGIGVTINDALAADAGLALDDGILVDDSGRTSHPAIYAAGDIARQHHGFIGGMVRQETWANALHQGAQAARAMVTGAAGTPEVPWFWTDQFGVNYQVAGRAMAQEWITRPGPDGQARMIFGLGQGVLTGVVGIDAGAEMRVARKLIGQGARPDPIALADPDVPLRAVGNLVHSD